MKSFNKKTYLILLAFLSTGIFIGYLIKPSTHQAHVDETHVHDEHSDVAETWTCSMHPQIQRQEPGDCPICGMDLIPLDDEQDESLDPRAIRMSESAMLLASVETALVGVLPVVKELRLFGKVQKDERLLRVQTSHIPGRIEKLQVNFTGEYVAEGSVIAYVYSPELVTAQKELFETMKVRDTHPTLYHAARQKLKNWKLSDAQIDKILDKGAPKEVFPVLSDASGYVHKRMATAGDYLRTGDGIYQLTDLSTIWVMFDVYEADMMWVRKGDVVTFTLAALPGESFEGKVAFIDPFINGQTRVVQARVEVNNDQKKFIPGMFAAGKLKAALPHRKEAIVVPKSAVMWTGKRSLVYVKSESDHSVHFMMREVLLGADLGDGYMIESGLVVGEEIAVSGTFSIDAAAQLSGRPSMMNSSLGKQLDVPDRFRQQLTTYLEAYFELKNALVESDYTQAGRYMASLKQALDDVNMQLLTNEPHQVWMSMHKSMQTTLVALSEATDIDAQRLHFSQLSAVLEEVVETFGHEHGTIYLAYCPMAFNDEGAYWLSEFKEIRNPYFGDMMMACGEVKKEFLSGTSRSPEIQQQHQGHQH